MSASSRITVTLPTEQVEELRRVTDNISGYVAEAVAQRLRHHLLGEALRQYEEEQGAFTEEEIADADARIAAALSTNPVELGDVA